MESEAKYPIKIVSMRTGLNQILIRTWENRYNIVKPERTDTNRRLYTDSDIEKLRLVKTAVEKGYKVGDIARYSIDELKELIKVDTPAAEIRESEDNLLDESLEMIRNYNSAGLQDILDIEIIKLSRNEFIQNLIFPLMMKIGELWESGEFTVSHEHFASAIIRNTLGRMISKSNKINAPVVLVCTPENQNHELIALAIAVLISQYNIKVIYLGSSVPAEELIKSSIDTGAELIILSIIPPVDRKQIIQYLEILYKALDTVIIIGGSAVEEIKDGITETGIIIENSIDSLLSRIQTMDKYLKY